MSRSSPNPFPHLLPNLVLVLSFLNLSTPVYCAAEDTNDKSNNNNSLSSTLIAIIILVSIVFSLGFGCFFYWAPKDAGYYEKKMNLGSSNMIIPNNANPTPIQNQKDSPNITRESEFAAQTQPRILSDEVSVNMKASQVSQTGSTTATNNNNSLSQSNTSNSLNNLNESSDNSKTSKSNLLQIQETEDNHINEIYDPDDSDVMVDDFINDENLNAAVSKIQESDTLRYYESHDPVNRGNSKDKKDINDDVSEVLEHCNVREVSKESKMMYT